MAYSGEDTEENRARVQKLNADLKKAKEQLEESEYDKYIADQKQLLDDFYSDLESWISERLDNLEAILQEAIEATNLNAELIKETIDTTAEETGVVLTDEFTKLWENMVASDSLFSGMADIEAVTSEICSGIKSDVELLPTMDGLSAYLDGETLAIVSEIASTSAAVNSVETAIGEANTALNQISSKLTEYNASVLASMASAQAAAEKAQQAAQQAQQTANEAKNKAESGGGNNNSNNTSPGNSDSGHRWSLSGMNGPFGTQYKTRAEAEEALNRLDAETIRTKKIRVIQLFKHGGVINDKDNPLDFLAQQLGEDHMIAAKEGERILTAKQNENFEKLANAFSSLSSEDMAKYSILTGNKMIGKMPTLQMPTLRDMNAGNSTEINGGISINLPNVTNKAEFVEWLRNDGQIEKIIQSMTLGKLQGKNSYDKMKY